MPKISITNINKKNQWPMMNDERYIIIMADRTIKITPLSSTFSETQIRDSRSKVSKAGEQAFVELQTPADIETFELAFQSNTIAGMKGAQHAPVKLNLESEYHSCLQNNTSMSFDFIELIQPIKGNFVVIEDCDKQKLASLTSSQIKKMLFSSFESVGRVLKIKNQIIAQFSNSDDFDKIETVFPNKKVIAMGKNAWIKIMNELDIELEQLWTEKEKNEEEQTNQEIKPELKKPTKIENQFLLGQKATSGQKNDGAEKDIGLSKKQRVNLQEESQKEKGEIRKGNQKNKTGDQRSLYSSLKICQSSFLALFFLMNVVWILIMI